jgi:hypothetical protein
MIKIFISHCAEDSAIAQSLAELFHSSLRLSKSDIRCTSVDGYRLPVGANTDEQLRREVLDAPVLVGLISHHSFESAYVLFELGARWGKNASLAPLLAPGVSTSILKGPISSLNALSCDSSSQIHQLVHDIASQLSITPEPPASYQTLVEAVSKARSSVLPAPSSSVPVLSSPSAHSTDDEYAGADEIISRHCEGQWQNDYAMRSYCEDEQRNAVEGLKHQAHDDIPPQVFEHIRSAAAAQWHDDFAMRLYTENEQLEAFRKLNRPKSSKGS